MKKLLALLLVFCLVLGLTACSEGDSDALNAGGEPEDILGGGLVTDDDSGIYPADGGDCDIDPAEVNSITEGGAEEAESAREFSDAPATTTFPASRKDSASDSVVHTPPDEGGSAVGGGGADDAYYGVAMDAMEPGALPAVMPEYDYGGDYIAPPYDPPRQVQAGMITAGEWKDNDNWEFWSGLLNQGGAFFNIAEHWKLHAGERSVIRVVDENSSPVRGAEATITNTGFKAVTDHNGVAYLFRKMGPNPDNRSPTTITVTVNGITETVTGSGDVVIAGAKSPAKKLDLMFMVDTTGSMGDELTYLQAEMENAINTVSRNNAQLPIRLSVNFYRDNGDEYVVRPFPFTTDISKAVRDLNDQYADGGGDTPEAVEKALENAINEHDWEKDSIKVMFIVLDAPPHHNTTTTAAMPRLMREAAAKGIRVVPVVSSAGCKETEFLMRNIAIITGGTYTFTTGHSGIGFGHVEPTIGDYDVEKLNDLIIRVINEYLS